MYIEYTKVGPLSNCYLLLSEPVPMRPLTRSMDHRRRHILRELYRYDAVYKFLMFALRRFHQQITPQWPTVFNMPGRKFMGPGAPTDPVTRDEHDDKRDCVSILICGVQYTPWCWPCKLSAIQVRLMFTNLSRRRRRSIHSLGVVSKRYASGCRLPV